MGVSRRTFLTISGSAVATSMMSRETLAGKSGVSEFDRSIAVLYDATKCIGCRSCMRACRDANGLPPEQGEIEGVAFDMPTDLDADNLMTLEVHGDIQAGTPEAEAPWSFVKRNCMHCLDPACVTACPVAALVKTDSGAVVYDASKCIGCRYCLYACPYGVPRYEWVDRVPRVRKCDWNRACVDACPVGALTQGYRREMIDEAHRRIEDEPGRYVDHVYGEHEAGGASYLILASIEHGKLGLPPLPPSSRAHFAGPIMHALPGWVIGMGLFLGGLHTINRRQLLKAEAAHGGGTHEEDTA